MFVQIVLFLASISCNFFSEVPYQSSYEFQFTGKPNRKIQLEGIDLYVDRSGGKADLSQCASARLFEDTKEGKPIGVNGVFTSESNVATVVYTVTDACPPIKYFAFKVTKDETLRPVKYRYSANTFFLNHIAERTVNSSIRAGVIFAEYYKAPVFLLHPPSETTVTVRFKPAYPLQTYELGGISLTHLGIFDVTNEEMLTSSIRIRNIDKACIGPNMFEPDTGVGYTSCPYGYEFNATVTHGVQGHGINNYVKGFYVELLRSPWYEELKLFPQEQKFVISLRSKSESGLALLPAVNAELSTNVEEMTFEVPLRTMQESTPV